MPLTPFHLGPGIAIKALGGRWFSFSVFCVVQVFIDAEVAFSLVFHQYPFHRFAHTYAGATVAAIAAVLVGRPLCLWFKRWWNANLAESLKKRLLCVEEVPLTAAIVGAFLGGYSHVLLDSVMHPDMTPLAPFTSTNLLLNRLSLLHLHLICMVLGAVGAAVLLRPTKKCAGI